MDKITIEGSNDSPKIILDAKEGYIYIGGSSLPENVFDIYNPVLEWLEKYTIHPNPVVKIDFFFDYLNTASSHMIMRLFEKIITLSAACEELRVNWHYLRSDHDMRDFGEELQELTHIPFAMIGEDSIT